MSVIRKRNKDLGLLELVAIALGGMVGGGIFTVLGISVSMIGNLTPIALIIGGLIALLAAYSYVKLGLYYKDEGATYSFFKRTYPDSHFSASIIGWFIIFGYISTLALYSFTFSSYALSAFGFGDVIWARKAAAIFILGVFTLINVWSVNGMGKIEDIMVYTKLVILVAISFVLIQYGEVDFNTFLQNMAVDYKNSTVLSVLIVASVTFVSYEGFQLVINAVNEMTDPDRNIPRAIYLAIFLAIIIYLVIATGALFSITPQEIVKNKEYALAIGAKNAIGKLGSNLVVLGAVLATSSAISGTVFGSSRQVAVIATDGYFPKWLSIRKDSIPKNAIYAMTLTASFLIVIGGLELILEFGSITFLLVSLLMAIANYKIKEKTKASTFATSTAILGLACGGILILYYEFTHNWEQMSFIIVLYVILGLGAWLFAKRHEKKTIKTID
ncbi:APC family permease [Flavobacterium sp. NRK F10]|uniref:Amino acid permease n=1 Tax=Flavobacterium sediminis TaxID=2201181 RepID=A0A2U8QTR9_9FLAO|nr:MULTISPECIES: APC family permease [Flavobacterium]AWM13573.1 amino acid permease [Flavobacterium sediminis]MCO6174697.1 APC family permease [Flavobacterium sp. NRK F10]